MEVFDLENVGEDILEELILPERPIVLGSRRLKSTAHGVLREIRVPHCDHCGQRLEQGKPTVICCVCNRKLCASDSCALEFERRHYCEEDIQQMLPLTKHSHMLLSGLIEGLAVKEIKDLAHFSNEEMRIALEQLLAEGYVEKRGISPFSTIRIRDRGILVWKTYASAYSHDGNVAHFEPKLADYMQEKKEKGCPQKKRLGK